MGSIYEFTLIERILDYSDVYIHTFICNCISFHRIPPDAVLHTPPCSSVQPTEEQGRLQWIWLGSCSIIIQPLWIEDKGQRTFDRGLEETIKGKQWKNHEIRIHLENYCPCIKGLDRT